MDTAISDISATVRQAQGGDTAAFARIVRQYQSLVSGVLYSMTGDFHRSEVGVSEAVEKLSVWRHFGTSSARWLISSGFFHLSGYRFGHRFEIRRRFEQDAIACTPSFGIAKMPVPVSLSRPCRWPCACGGPLFWESIFLRSFFLALSFRSAC